MSVMPAALPEDSTALTKISALGQIFSLDTVSGSSRKFGALQRPGTHRPEPVVPTRNFVLLDHLYRKMAEYHEARFVKTTDPQNCVFSHGVLVRDTEEQVLALTVNSDPDSPLQRLQYVTALNLQLNGFIGQQ
jgi:hypothetical protein